MTEGQIINDYHCEACNQKVDLFKRNLVADTPNVLIIHLQRIVFNFDTFMNDKINSRFEFPTILNLKPYSFKEVMDSEERAFDAADPNVKEMIEHEDDEYCYRLVGVTIHIGTAEHGHYYSLINTKRGAEEPEESKGEWMTPEKDALEEFEDEKIKHYPFSDLKTDSFGGAADTAMSEYEMNAYLASTGGSFGKNAYMLVYERKKKKALRQIVTQHDLADSSANQD
eukprot:CAMPEP_0202964448 /NCGR_PEP_ID=MMETSP1396-20130829/8531_1 /ASSEMBLY_ACC=CAM_ASM_000872 /TAXON_ID= /ORGANISM="Pseudokeronopsis sp., Strain Brazil" /LENGTH=225 /DNA_ID=CAMNT_0049686561 /DNA_START=316 /DNA_END=993 /DNA_ORIENTATION=+